MRKEIKESEARVLVYLSVVDKTRTYVSAMSAKLNYDESYLMRILRGMTLKGWLTKHQFKRHVFYQLTKTAPLELAKNAFNSASLETSLNDYVTPMVEVQTEEQTKEVQDDQDPILES